LKHLAKTWQHLSTALGDQLVCGLHDYKFQWDLLSISDLTLEVALQKAMAAEMADKSSILSKELYKITNLAIAEANQAISLHCVSFRMLHVRRLDIW